MKRLGYSTSEALPKPPPLRQEEDGRVFETKFSKANNIPAKRGISRCDISSSNSVDQRLSLHLLEEHLLRHDVETNVMFDNTLLAH